MEQHDDLFTPDQKLVSTIAAAGSVGLTRRDITQRFRDELDRKTLWQLLDALAGFGELVAMNDVDDIRYVARTVVAR